MRFNLFRVVDDSRLTFTTESDGNVIEAQVRLGLDPDK